LTVLSRLSEKTFGAKIIKLKLEDESWKQFIKNLAPTKSIVDSVMNIKTWSNDKITSELLSQKYHKIQTALVKYLELVFIAQAAALQTENLYIVTLKRIMEAAAKHVH
jgi:hypothetical protein